MTQLESGIRSLAAAGLCLPRYVFMVGARATDHLRINDEVCTTFCPRLRTDCFKSAVQLG
jgi:hypothetical protein